MRFKNILWIKNSSKNSWYVDSFIYEVYKDRIVIFAEEYINRKPGRLVELTIDRGKGEILSSKIILERDSHLSYPQIVNEDDITHIILENGAANIVGMYKIAEEGGIEFIKELLNMSLYDSTIYFNDNNKTLNMFAIDKNRETYLFKSDSLMGNW